MRRASTPAGKLRLFNALVASAIAVFFLAHSLLGAASFFVEGLVNHVPWLTWAMFGAVGIHVFASAGATASMLTDTERPPSSRKKRHFVLKWTTGAVLALVIAAHLICVLCPENLLAFSHQAKVPFLLLLAALAWHVGIATKSLARDLGIGKRTRDIMRATYVLGILALIVLLLLAS
ncbi:hypothetical protein [uncultured Ellagibacter sp.]|uniref:hypothetical protein n=1 Tax=uncultured Ellagibacter sp. TaxID=2137580 RepID=UPI0026281530|nr:hypothetical protein [uncultured Ellagibacter sp.]